MRDAVREESRAAFREAILGAAERVFGRLGFSDAKMADIAAEAGVAAGTLYNYFKNKDEVFNSILERGRDQVTALFDSHAEVVDPLERTRLRMRDAFAYLEEHGVLFSMFLRIVGVSTYAKKRALDEHGEHSYAASVHRTLAVIREACERGQLRRDIPDEDLAAMLMGMCDATIFAWTRAGCPPGLVSKADTIVELFLRGAQAP
jgi:AcrR family transcriptional regulator